MRYLFPLSPYNQQRQFQKATWVYPVHLAMFATALRDNGHEVEWGRDETEYPCPVIRYVDDAIESDSQINIPFLDLPAPDRVFTDAKNPRWQKNGNYKYHPSTHMMSALGCSHGKCSFCYEKGKEFIVRPVDKVLEEVETLISQGYKEVFDDSATFPGSEWRKRFIREVHRFRKQILFGCNLRISDDDFIGLRNCGFRMVLVGIESANQITLDKINKGIKAKDIIPVLKKMSESGLEPHITVMFGYPWESHEEAMNTVRLVHYLLKKGYAKTAQASVFCPPRTAPDKDSPANEYVKKVYDVYKSPEFLWRKLSSIREWADIKYLIRSGRLVFTEKYKATSK